MPRPSKEIVRKETIIQQPLEDVMHNSMIPYAEYVVMERALPRVEDGLKPVQRRILYTMRELANTPDKPHKKSARIAGDTMGKYHPHGDTSIYDAMVRMAQDFSMRAPLVDGHGNFGSVDGDSAAAMRYTEVRMTPLALELLKDIDKDTVPFSLNFDDTLKEPDMLPGRFPNLLVNGAMGIAVGLATNIPTHNLGEVIDGAVAFIDNPDITIAGLMEHVKGPDFPTGGLIIGKSGIREAYETGRGRIKIRAKASIEDAPGGKQNIVITEIPYQINKASMLEKILKLSEEKKGILTGINDIRDESDRTGMRAVIEVKKNCNAEKILQYLFKYSDLEVNFNVNCVAIADGKPQLLNLKQIYEYYTRHQIDVVTRRTQFDLEKAEAREHILEGLLVAIRNIDEVIAIIKKSASPQDARHALMKRFDLTGVQAQAILDMRLQRLTALEVTKLEEELAEVRALIAELRAILNSKAKLMHVIKSEMLEIKKNYADARRTKIVSADSVAAPEPEDFVLVEDIVITATRRGYVKIINEKTFNRSDTSAVIEDLAEGDMPVSLYKARTVDNMLFFTNQGNCFRLAASAIPEGKWRSRGTHLSAVTNGYALDENIIGSLCFDKFPAAGDFVFVSRQGMVKKTKAEEYETRNKKIVACGVKEDDELIFAGVIRRGMSVLFITKNGFALNVLQSQIPEMGRAAKGVKGIELSRGDEVIAAHVINEEGEVVLVSNKGYAKRVMAMEFTPKTRATKGTRCFTFNKNASNGEILIAAEYIKEPQDIVLNLREGQSEIIKSTEISLQNLDSRGKPVMVVVFDNDVVGAYINLS